MDMISTWWFMVPLIKSGIEPSKYEAGLTAKWLVRTMGVQEGLLINGFLEVFTIASLLTLTVFTTTFITHVDIVLSALFWNSIALTYFTLVVRNNYAFGKQTRKSLLVRA
jgi:hypothetical protein